MKRFLKYALAAPLAIALSACSFLDVEPKILAPETFYKSEAEVLYGLAGVYGPMNNEAIYGNHYSCQISGVDDLCYYNRASASPEPYFYNFGTTHTVIYQCWTMLYAGIKNANEFMSAMEEVRESLDPNLHNYSEARFMRAYYHFLLAQAWGDVPLRDKAVKVPTPSNVQLAATPQAEVLLWCVKEMEECLPNIKEGVEAAPSRITRSAIQGILARVYLFMAGETVDLDGLTISQEGSDVALTKKLMYEKAAYWAKQVIDSNLHQLNPVYADIFINMIGDKYDTQYRESIWEADFVGDRTTDDKWTNGRIGEVIGMQSTSSKTNFSEWKCNYSYGFYNGSLKLWDLYWANDRTDDEAQIAARIIDTRQDWNMAAYNYAGTTTGTYVASMDKTPYTHKGESSIETPTAGAGNRNCSKWRREVEYEGSMTAKSLYNGINFPILRYSDVLLMYAEAVNESTAATAEAWTYVKQVRDRAGIKSRDYGEYSSQDAMRQLIRNERGRELCFEALRKYDLIRWGIFEQEMKLYSRWANDVRWVGSGMEIRAAVVSANIQPKHVYLPIPSTELGVNKLLKQHPLW